MLVIVLATAAVLVGCASAPPPAPTVTANPTTPTAGRPSPSPTRRPRATATADESAPAPTATPTATATELGPTPVVDQGTPLAVPAAPISLANLAQLAPLAHWGKGGLTHAAWMPDGRLVVASTLGLFLYDGTTLEEVERAPLDTAVERVAVSPDGSLVAAALPGGELSLWDAIERRWLRRWPAHTAGVTALAFNPDGTLLVSGGKDGRACVWRVADGGFLNAFQPINDSTILLALSPDGEVLATAAGSNVTLRRLSDGSVLRILMGAKLIGALAFAPDGATLAAGSSPGAITVWRVEDGLQVQAWDESEEYVYLRLWDLAFSPDGQLLATASSGSARIWRVSDGVLLQDLEGAWVDSLAFSPDGARLAGASGPHSRLWLWQVSDGRLLEALDDHTAEYADIVFTPDGQNLVATTYDNLVQQWNVATARLASTIRGALPEFVDGPWITAAMAFSPGGETLAWWSWDRQLDLLRLPDAVRIGTIDWRPGMECYGDMAVSPHGEFVAVSDGCHGERVDIRRGARGEQVAALGGYQGDLAALAFSPDGRLLAVITSSELGLWRVGDGEPLWHQATIEDWPEALVFARDGEMLAVSYRQEVYVWRVSDGELVYGLPDDGGRAGYSALAFSPDGRLLAVASRGDVLLWRASDGAFARRLHAAYAGRMPALAFSPDGRLLAGAGEQIQLWGVVP